MTTQIRRGPKYKVTDEDAIDAFGRIKDGELHYDLSMELGVDQCTLRAAFRRLGLIDEKRRAA